MYTQTAKQRQATENFPELWIMEDTEGRYCVVAGRGRPTVFDVCDTETEAEQFIARNTLKALRAGHAR